MNTTPFTIVTREHRTVLIEEGSSSSAKVSFFDLEGSFSGKREKGKGH